MSSTQGDGRSSRSLRGESDTSSRRLASARLLSTESLISAVLVLQGPQQRANSVFRSRCAEAEALVRDEDTRSVLGWPPLVRVIERNPFGGFASPDILKHLKAAWLVRELSFVHLAVKCGTDYAASQDMTCPLPALPS